MSRRPENSILGRGPAMWLGYTFIGLYAYELYGLAQASGFFRAQEGLSATLAGLHATAFAAGLVISGLLGARAVSIAGPRRSLWTSCALMVAAGVVIAFGPRNSSLSIAVACLQGVAGGVLLAVTNTLLIESHADRPGAALSEANVAASACSLAGPLVIGALVQSGLGWEPFLLVPVGILVAAFVLFGRIEVPWTTGIASVGPGAVPGATSSATSSAPSGSLPAGFWIRWIVVLLAIAIEFAVVFWAASLLQARGLSDESAAAADLAWLVAGMLVARVLDARLGASPLLRGRILPFGFALAGIATVGVWVLPDADVALASLFVAGLGIGVLYPEAVAAAVAAAPGLETAASARCSLAFGLALLSAPLALGAAADRVGVWAAFPIVPAMAVLAVVLLIRPGVTRAR